MNHAARQIRHPISYFYGAAVFCGLWLAAALLSPDSRMVFITAAVITLLYGLLSFRNDRLAYDEDGVTLYSVWGKPFRKSWADIDRMDVAEEPLISRRLSVGRVLRISFAEQSGKRTVTYRFPYQYYVGIDEFLCFYRSLIHDQ